MPMCVELSIDRSALCWHHDRCIYNKCGRSSAMKLMQEASKKFLVKDTAPIQQNISVACLLLCWLHRISDGEKNMAIYTIHNTSISTDITVHSAISFFLNSSASYFLPHQELFFLSIGYMSDRITQRTFDLMELWDHRAVSQAAADMGCCTLPPPNSHSLTNQVKLQTAGTVKSA